MTETMLRVSALNKRFGGIYATNNLNLDVAQGQIHAIIGPNGAGKTTLIAQLSGQIKPDS
ncbi:MAG: branched-chain amino acid transport system ATP-binding protein, partial [Planctomycetota bacterium]